KKHQLLNLLKCLANKNPLAREARAKCAANETTKEAEQHQSAQRQAYTQFCAKETNKEAEQHLSIQRQAYAQHHKNKNFEEVEHCHNETNKQTALHKKRNEVNKHTSNLACIDNYDTTVVIPHSIGCMNVECP
ncbi:38764_t:CDS:2, partial [Gigaspora margarita]